MFVEIFMQGKSHKVFKLEKHISILGNNHQNDFPLILEGLPEKFLKFTKLNQVVFVEDVTDKRLMPIELTYGKEVKFGEGLTLVLWSKDHKNVKASIAEAPVKRKVREKTRVIRVAHKRKNMLAPVIIAGVIAIATYVVVNT